MAERAATLKVMLVTLHKPHKHYRGSFRIPQFQNYGEITKLR